MAVKTVFEHQVYRNIGLSTDTKPHGQTPLSTFIEYDTFDKYTTYDGTNWVRDDLRVVGTIKEISAEIVVDGGIGAYLAKDVVGNEDCCSASATYTTFPAVVRANAGYGRILGARLFNETENQAVQYDLHLFNAAPTGELRDNWPNTNPIKGDKTKYIGKIAFPSTEANGATVASTSIATTSTMGNLPIPFKCVTVDDIYAVLVTNTAYTQTAADDIRLTLIVEQL
jgi:hypothetical protein|tara:strand:- start:8629 stop:9306 length:678 start_codon:yes stop_codon:yes gene_type:complete